MLEYIDLRGNPGLQAPQPLYLGYAGLLELLGALLPRLRHRGRPPARSCGDTPPLKTHCCLLSFPGRRIARPANHHLDAAAPANAAPTAVPPPTPPPPPPPPRTTSHHRPRPPQWCRRSPAAPRLHPPTPRSPRSSSSVKSWAPPARTWTRGCAAAPATTAAACTTSRPTGPASRAMTVRLALVLSAPLLRVWASSIREATWTNKAPACSWYLLPPADLQACGV